MKTTDIKYYAHNKQNIDQKKLVWNVFYENVNAKKIEVFNIFDHGSFNASIYKLKKETDFDKFCEDVHTELIYYFWSKSEWETVITSWPPHITREEVDRIQNKTILVDIEKEQEERKTLSQEEISQKIAAEFKSDKEYVRYLGQVNLHIDEKIDVYTQIMLNWNIFINYLWNNKNLIKKIKY